MAKELWDRRNPPALTLGKRPGVLPVRSIWRRIEEAWIGLPADRREAALGLALLWHDHWDEAHAIAQAHETRRDFDFLHALGHRREGDYDNAAYWLARVRNHPILPALGARVAYPSPGSDA